MADEPEITASTEPPAPAAPTPEPAAEPAPAPAPVAAEPAAEPVASAEPAQEPTPAVKPAKAKSAQQAMQERIDELTRIRRAQEKEIADLRTKQAPTDPEPAASGGPTQEQLDKLVADRAASLVAQQTYGERANNWLKNGIAEFKDDFNEKCNTVASLGAADRPEFMQIVTDPDIIPDGHKVVAALADDPTEAMRILALPPVQMAAALVRYSEKTARPASKAISAAPAPIKPLDGTARGNDEPSASDSEDEWFRKREAQVRERKQGGARF